jgi:Domain of unknown function (DUF4136)
VHFNHLLIKVTALLSHIVVVSPGIEFAYILSFPLFDWSLNFLIMKRFILTIGALSAVVAMSSCNKEPLNNLTEEESRIYITNHNDSVNFGAYHTFSIADSVAVISNNQLEEKAITDVDAAYIAAVKQQMQDRGYTLVPRDQNPDIGINVNRIYNSYTGVFSYSDYLGDYYGYWDPYYWGYGGYGYDFPTYYGTYQVEEGALSIDMLDLKDAASSNKIKGIWNGLIRGSGVFNSGKAGSQVKALFDQSMYLQSNQ